MIKILRVTAIPNTVPDGGSCTVVLELSSDQIGKVYARMMFGVSGSNGEEFSPDQSFERAITTSIDRTSSHPWKIKVRPCYGRSWVCRAYIYKTRLPNGKLEDEIDHLFVDPIYQVT